MDQRGDSLAAQAAAWVPPWERPAPPDPAPEEVDGESAAPAGTAGEVDAESAAPAGTAGGVDVECAATAPGMRGGSSPEIVAGPEAEALADASAEAPAEAAGALDEPATELATEPGEDVAAVAVAASAVEPAGQRSPVPAQAVPVPPVSAESTAAPAALDDAELRAALEAILLVVDEPVADAVLAEVLEQPTGRVSAAVASLSEEYTAAGRGFDLRRAAGGWRLYTRGEYAAYVERFILGGQTVRLTQAALETLAVVAYKQPVTRSRISAIRGVNCDGVTRTLVNRGLIEECGAEPESGAYLYRTTTLFLEKLGLDSVAELPSLAPFLPEDVEEIADAQR